MLKRIALLALALLGVLVTVLLVRAWPRGPDAQRVAPAHDIALDTQAVAARLAEAIRIPTISDERPIAQRAQPFLEFRSFLERAYPAVHAALPREIISDYTLLYTWRGSDPALAPILLMGHMDVVPVAPGSDTTWTHEPFSGAVVDGQVWGRGALDDKQHVITILDAAEWLLARQFQPRRTIYLLFGHDEEVSGTSGALQAAQLLEQRNVRLQFVLDEGGIIGEGLLPGLQPPLALVKIAGKGYLTLELSVPGAGGHSSAPPRPTPVGILARAIVQLENRPFPARLEGASRALLETVAGQQPLPSRLVVRNLWLFAPLVKQRMARAPGTDATLRTTIAPTMLQASPKDNVLPTLARAVVNFRLLPGESSQDVIDHVRAAIDDPRVQIRSLVTSEAPPASDPGAEEFRLLSLTIRQVAPDVMVAPFLLTAATDSRHFSALTDHVFGFSTSRGGNELLTRAHGTNERIRTSDLVTGVRFYVQLMRNAAGS
ncbi:MAG: M20 family peptidase [Longimicrobiales bacterium]